MCGIVGIIQLNGQAIEPGSIQRAASAIRHRGPNDEGCLFLDTQTYEYLITGGKDTPREVFESRFKYSPKEKLENLNLEQKFNLVLGHRRLSIIDLSSAGHQPMCNEEGTVWIIHNGEIYNYQDIQKELITKGHKFCSNTDTEVIIHAYEEWGTECLNRFNGMWSFAILDLRNKKLFCSRDRFGVKPFYYFWDGSTFIFASEIKSILASGLVYPQPNETVVYKFLAYGWQDYIEETFFKDINQLRGGHYLEFLINDKKSTIHKYYDFPLDKEFSSLTDEEYAKRFYEIFEDAVRLRLISDVPVGMCLSGGLDSSSIVSVVRELVQEKEISPLNNNFQNTFSARYDDPRHDENLYIHSVINNTGINAYFAYPTAQGLKEEIENLIWHQEEPFGTTSIYAQWCVFKLAKQTGVTVTLDGQGADEMLGGYTHYFGPYFAQLLKTFKWQELIKEIYWYRRLHASPFKEILRSIFLNLLPTEVRTRFKNVFHCPPWVNKAYFKVRDNHSTSISIPKDKLEGQMYYDLMVGLNKLLRFEDRNSMAHSIESRLPFLDYRLAEFMFSLPYNQKIMKGLTKIVLRNAMKGILPELVRDRKDKIGFSTPEDVWFREGFKDFISELINSKTFLERPYFKVGRLKESIEKHFQGKINISNEIWRAVNLELWMRQFIDKNQHRS